MTYKQVLDDFFTIINQHNMIKTAGYGPLSEIKVPRGTYDTNYPYAFLQPTNHTLGEHQMVYRFNLIMMEMCNEDIDSVIEAQSNCLQYVKDILGHLYYHYNQYDFNLNFSVVPFKEKYDDVVSGVTATVELITRDALDDCIAPFSPTPTQPEYLVIAEQTNQRTFENGGAAWFEDIVLLDDGGWDRFRYRLQDPEPREYFFDINLEVKFNQPLPNQPQVLDWFLEISKDLPSFIVLDNITIVDGPFVSTDEVYNFSASAGPYTLQALPGGNDIFFRMKSLNPTTQTPDGWQISGEIRIFRLD